MLTVIIADGKHYELNFSPKSYSSSSRRFDVVARILLELAWAKHTIASNILSNDVFILFRSLQERYVTYSLKLSDLSEVSIRNEYSLMLHLIKEGILKRTCFMEVQNIVKDKLLIHLTEKGKQLSKAKEIRDAVILMGGHGDVPEDVIVKLSKEARSILEVNVGPKSYLASQSVFLFMYFDLLTLKNVL